MDPKANLEEQLRLAAQIIAQLDDSPDDSVSTFVEDKALRLAELVQALDGWRRKGGFDPYDGPQPPLPDEQSYEIQVCTRGSDDWNAFTHFSGKCWSFDTYSGAQRLLEDMVSMDDKRKFEYRIVHKTLRIAVVISR